MKIEQLIEKYNKPGPRYTSYPPVPFWTGAPSEETWLTHIKENSQQGIDLYVHVPFCEKLCWYCGCNRTITKDHGVEGPYMKVLLQEWKLYQSKLGFIPQVNSLHFGGGTPTFLSPSNLELLIKELTINRSSTFIGSIEIDPRTCSENHLKVLKDTHISRVSLGIQDFDPEVQKAINRFQPISLVDQLLSKLHKYDFKSINFDLIYGLPKQTLGSISKTIDIVSQMRPDLIAFYGYAHLPGRIKNQRLINEADLPSASLRRSLYECGKEILSRVGYYDIGMDHFALPNSYLYEAQEKRTLHRNFMGYVDKKSPVLIGLGPTSISDSSKSFTQNAKDLKEYERLIEQGKLPLENGHQHTLEDLVVQEMILKLMCQGEVTLASNLPQVEGILKELEGFKQDGIITQSQKSIKLSAMGKTFMRNVAMSFDYRLRDKQSEVKFSQTI